MTMIVAVIGLGKLGACMAATLATNLKVIGVDVDKKVVKAMNEGKALVAEPGLQELLTRNHERLSATTDTVAAIKESDASFVIVPTPSKPAGDFSTAFVEKVFAEIAKGLKERSGYHLVTLVSTVMPGATRKLIKVLEEGSGKVCGKDFGVCYSPEFIALGEVIKGMLHPDFRLIGSFDEKSEDVLFITYQKAGFFDLYSWMSLEEAELTKLSINSFVTMKITFANMLAMMCEKIPGCNIDIVTAALGMDSRIGRKYLKGGLGYGGPCFPRDNLAMLQLASSLRCPIGMFNATDSLNRVIPTDFPYRFNLCIREGMKATVLGMAYKPGTNVVEESQGLRVANALALMHAKVTVYDPLLSTKTVHDVLKGAELVVVANNDPAFLQLTAADFDKPVTVVDCWRMLPLLKGVEGINYIALGQGKDR